MNGHNVFSIFLIKKERMGGQAEGLACADPGARTPIGASRISFSMSCQIGEWLFSIACVMMKAMNLSDGQPPVAYF